MKGKNKLVLTLFAVFALVLTSVAFALSGTVESIRYANASASEAFTTELEGGVIFSAERVYFAEDRSQALTYTGGYNFNSVQTNKGTEYFGDYALRDQLTDGDYSHKDIIADGDFVMVDDNAIYTTNEDVSIKQGIMITLGGYYYNSSTKQYELNGVETGAGMSFVAAQAFRNGKAIEIPNARSYNSGSCQDFTWFITPEQSTEGHYEISLSYMINGVTLRYDFDFYLLLLSSYDREVEVVTSGYSHIYHSKPTMDNAPIVTTNNYQFFSGTSLDYPTLTFDYSRYALEYTHVSGDVTTTVKLDYDEANGLLNLTKSVYNDEETETYVIDNGGDKNTIVTLMFVDHGKYTFHFDHIYKYSGEKIVIPQEQIPFENMTLNIYGYQLKYSKAGFTSADMVYLEIYKNNTMFILVNGYMNADNETTGDALGVQYKLITDNATQKTGVVNKDTSKTASVLRNQSVEGAGNEDIDKLISSGMVDVLTNRLYDEDNSVNNYQRTDRGLWLTLNDEYYFENTSFFYHDDKPISAELIKNTSKRQTFEKVTTFTAPGYYLVQVKYKYTDTDIATQWFAFQITSATPALELFKTSEDVLSGNVADKIEDFYAHEYTNKNVYATWKDTEIFESTIVGKLYYVAGSYASEATLKAVANGKSNTSVTKLDYQKFDLIKNSGAYLLVLEVERSATKTYTYFTIDKEAISGLEVYEVVTNSIDNRAVYAIKQDAQLNYVKHTSKGVIDTTFTLDWANKASGANISANYYFTPFVKTNTSDPLNNTITIDDNIKYIINEYTLGQRSNLIQIQKPTQLNIALDVNNVLMDQGIYEFYLKDQAGNELVYIVVVDKTEGVINATYSDKNSTYISGQLVADYVKLEWGTHKAISLGDGNETVASILTGEITNYYRGTDNNWWNLIDMFKPMDGENLFVVENLYTEIKLIPFESTDNYYVLTNRGTQQIKYPNGITATGWSQDDLASTVFENATNMGIKINVDKSSDHIYKFVMVGNNQVTSTSNTTFTVRITPDSALGEVYSAGQEGADYSNYVRAKGGETKYFGNDVSNENLYLEHYYEGQASNDGVFVFEWTGASDQDKFEVTEVKYNYYQLMDQITLNAITKDTLSNYPYYPYKYISTNYILQTEDGMETVSQYDKGTRNRSYPINLAYETYYDANGALTSKKVTQTGLYIITRTISMKVDENEQPQVSEYSYAFFVDRNMIVGYSITDINQKIVGQFIHVAMPNSEGSTAVKYDNFTKQGLKPQTNNGITYQVYLETNKLPTRVQVPSGKYVSGVYDNSSDKAISTIYATSYKNLKLKLSVYFLDSNGILPSPYKNAFVQLMDNKLVELDGFIELTFDNIDNQAVVTMFRNARIHGEDNSLSLPGTYVFVINDTVGSSLDKNYEVDKTNQFVFGVKLIDKKPTTDMYAYANIAGEESDKVYADESMELYTNQQYVDFIIPIEDLKSYEAQLDIANISIWRSTTEGGTKSLWLRLMRNTSGNITAATNGIIQDLSQVEEVYKDGKLVSYIIKLDTGLTIDGNGQIIDYKEYVYNIDIQYILENSGVKYYQYQKDGETKLFYSSSYKVVIDRTPNSDNLNNIMKGQNDYFEKYQAWLAEQNNTELTGAINQNYAYRSIESTADYYGLTNSLYYQFATTGGQLSSSAMYALNVDFTTTFNSSELSAIYYRRLDFNASNIANTRMGLLPITETYFVTNEYYTFNENLSAYSFKSPQEFNNNTYYWTIMDLNKDANNSYESDYINKCGGFYEIVEKDKAGNYTQYVIYFAPQKEAQVSINITGKVIGTNYSSTTLPFNITEIEDEAFTGITGVTSVAGLASKNGNQSYPYYGNINIYNSSREKIKTIYINSTSDHNKYEKKKETDEDGVEYEIEVLKEEGFEQEIYNVIKEQGNYIIEYVNVFGKTYTIFVNNYTSDKHKLTTATFALQTDYAGQDYLTFSGLNSRIDDRTYWYVTEVKITYYSNAEIIYTAGPPENGQTELNRPNGENEVWRDSVELDRLNLKKGIQYLVTLTDVGGNKYHIPISTSENYYNYRLFKPDNIYSRDNVVYTANQIQLSYNTDFYEDDIIVYVNGEVQSLEGDEYKQFYTYSNTGSYCLVTLLPDVMTTTSKADYYGSLRRFEVKLKLKDGEDYSQTYDIYIDTRATDFTIENTNKVDKIEFIKSTFKNDKDEDGLYQDYNIMDLRNSIYYEKLISETINISWTRLTNDYFTYNYELFEFISADEYVELLKNSTDTFYTIAPKESNTGKYVLKVTIEGKDGTWIATRVYGIFMSTTITGLYEVKDGDGYIYDYASITNLGEIKETYKGNETAMAIGLGFVDSQGNADTVAMHKVFNSFGLKTAIPMYIANTELTLHSNQDNGVSSKAYEPTASGYAKISVHRIYRSNYQTFAVIMQVSKDSQNLLQTLSFITSSTTAGESLLNSGTSKTIYNANAEYYRLVFGSYNQNTASNVLERHNKIIIDVSYNNVFAKRVKGGDEPTTYIDFQNSGSYKLEVSDMAGNKHDFVPTTGDYIDNFTVVVMKDMLYTINGEAPIPYAYYDSAVTLQINRYNDATGKNNYDINTITLKAIRNSEVYTGYEHPTESATYVFKDYGTYLITISAKLLGTDIEVSSQLVFTILNPNEARTALDFTSIYGYNIISVFSITKTAEKDVTSKFMDLLQDKSNVGDINVYNKLITYERLVEIFGTSTQGKMKFRVLYEVENDDLLPARRAEFSFTLNNETATLTSSIKAGGKTTDSVKIKFNAANIYDQIGDCNLVINGEVVLRIDENSLNQITELEIKEVGKYYVQLMGDSGNISTSFNFTIKEPLNMVAIILIVVVVAIVAALIGTFIWLRTRMKVR